MSQGDRATNGRGDVWLGDVLAAWSALGAGSDDDRRLIANALGFDYQPRQTTAPAVAARPDQQRPVGHAVQAKISTVRPPAAALDGAPGSAGKSRSLPLQLDVRKTPSGATPAWALVTDPIPEDEARHLVYTPAAEPLLRRGWTRGIVAALCATRINDGPIDLTQLVQSVCAGRPLTTLPRSPVWTLRRGVQLLVEDSEDFACFARDVTGLIAAIADTVGHDRTLVTYAEDVSALPALAGSGPGGTWEWPPSGTPIVVAATFGMTRRARARGIGTTDDWRRLASAARTHGNDVIGITPFGPDRWPAALRQAFPLFHWNRTATAAGARRIRQP